MEQLITIFVDGDKLDQFNKLEVEKRAQLVKQMFDFQSFRHEINKKKREQYNRVRQADKKLGIEEAPPVRPAPISTQQMPMLKRKKTEH
mmetsp:Transcript_19050/g.29216  ORF Transcript_19050/g.29216 Transcript_19050/m.29216 type:complete len:89 (+) Transcript_19050:581-847(+)|eukprot:CAMPEP_0170492366 /NCGR_PEP_ID=MMETSP0208-20121228/12124_1 /TAXON_ID=197538 /ORGANISM="Strombidium inclinatum, Strain S3" /LENGTH=88 /DNA_ID=CAMNT_0010768093 /DNA_START=581 /DNA_END=847 /DNA_ORIENTATION=+